MSDDHGYAFDLYPLTKLDIPSNTWINRETRDPSIVLRTDKGTGSVYYSDCCGSYDKNGVYQSVWYHIEMANGDWISSIEALAWNDAKQKVEEILK